MSQISAMDLSNAPRDIEELKRKGRFQLRQLAETLEIISDKDPQAKLAFMALDTEKQAAEILSALKAKDNATNGAGHAAAAEAPKTGLKRTPSNKGVEAPVSPSASAGASVAPFTIAPLMEALKVIGGKLDAVLSNQAVILEKLDNVSTLAALSTATSLTVGETTLNAARGDILAQAIGDVELVVKEVSEHLGKGKK